MRLSPTSTSTRTFVVVPALTILEQAIRRRRWHLGWSVLMAWGFLQYKLVGTARLRRAGGPPGMSQGYPERLVTDGAYAVTRNPMYLGHLIYLAGLTLTTRSPVALGHLAWAVPWFDSRAARDEERLRERFGVEYERYRHQVPRWVPRRGAKRPIGSPVNQTTRC